ncbi:unnamed protein product [Sphagnum tenellum]
MESRLQMLRDLTTDRMGNSVLSDDVTLESLVPITWNLNDAQLEQCMNIAKRNGLNRLPSIVTWTLKTSKMLVFLLNPYNLFPIGKDESGLWGGKLVATSQLCL